MPVLTQRIEVAPRTVPAKYGLLATVRPQPMPDRAAQSGVYYETDYCGVAQPWVAPCADPTDLGTISVSVSNARLATITGTGEPAGTGYTVDWGAGTPDTDVALDGQTNTYTVDGDYTVNVTGPDGYTATVDITVTNGQTSGPFTATAVDTKVGVDGFGETSGLPVVIYHQSTCRLVGSGTEADRVKRAKRGLELGASRAVEEAFGTVIADDAVDITPSGTAVTATKGLALLEQYGGANYGGQRFIHADAATVTILDHSGVLYQVGDHLETIQGSIVVAGPGYADSTPPSAAAAGARWMYATGAVNVWQQDIDVTETVINSNPYDNEYRVLAERIYVPTYECFAAAAEVTMEI